MVNWRDDNAELARNRRLLELARHNGYEIEVCNLYDNRQWWLVPVGLVSITGFMAGVV